VQADRDAAPLFGAQHQKDQDDYQVQREGKKRTLRPKRRSPRRRPQ
jgi:hypothetical protein